VESHPASTPAPLPPPLTVDVKIDGPGSLLAIVTGQIDRASVPTLKEHLAAAQARQGPQDAIVDLTDVEFIDSSGLHMLLQIHQEHGGQGTSLVLLAPTEPVKGLLALTGLDRYLMVVDTLPDAMARLAERDGVKGRAQAS
jgi:anti-sigma B factor antagonist